MSKPVLIYPHRTNEGIIKVVISLIALLMGMGIAVVASAQEELTFGFNPPDGTSFVETIRYTKSLYSAGVLQPETQVKEGKSRYRISRTEAGYSIEVTPILPDLRLSEGTEGIIRSMFSTVAMTFYLNVQGRLVRIQGPELVLDKLKKLLPEELYQAVLSGLGQSAQDPAQLAANMWLSRAMLGIFAGQTLRTNHVYKGTGDFPLPIGGSTSGTVRMKISWPVSDFSVTCAKVESTFESEDETVGKRLGVMIRTMLVNAVKSIDPSFDESEIPDFKVTGSRSSSEDTRLVDPATGLLYSETETRTLKALFGLDAKGMSTFVVKEVLEYGYEFQKQ